MRLFADQGFTATSVGQIEAAVGLVPRRGALYRHFPSKDALLEAGVRQHLDSVATGVGQLRDLEVGPLLGAEPEDRRQLALAAGRWFLDELDRQEQMTRVLEHDGGRLTAQRDQIRREIVDAGHGAAASLLAAMLPAIADPDATAVILLGALVAFRRTRWTFGAAPLALDDERVLIAWADLWESLTASLGSPGR